MTSTHVPASAAVTACPKCGHPVVSERGAAPWCPQCEWNLATYEPSRRGHGDFSWRLPDRWAFRVAYRQTYADLRPRMPARRQLSTRDEASLFATHPPAGLRAAMIASRLAQTATVALSNAASARIDTELAGAYTELGRGYAYQ